MTTSAELPLLCFAVAAQPAKLHAGKAAANK
jgi:hypothetical protein